MVCQCAVCSRMFEVSELYKKMVEAKKHIPTCGYCSKENEDDDNKVVDE